jgi:tRNA-dihydrouridine synthase B
MQTQNRECEESMPNRESDRGTRSTTTETLYSREVSGLRSSAAPSVGADETKPALFLAPLHGVTNRVFRQAYFRHFNGFDAAFAPFIQSVKAGSRMALHFKDLLPGYEPALPLIPQILGNDASDFVDTARMLADLGYREVNWNLGCPYPMVTGKGRGSGLLPQPQRIKAILDHVCARSPLPVSVKVRLGYQDKRELLELMPVFNSLPLARLVIHPRLASQMYEGQVDIDGFNDAYVLSLHPVMYNGDIRDVQTYTNLAARFPALRQWMLGRGALADPFLAGRIKESACPAQTGDAVRGPDRFPSCQAVARVEQARMIRAFHDDLLEAYCGILSGQKHVLDKMKEVWTFLEPWFGSEPRVLKSIAKAGSLELYQSAVNQLFRSISEN